MSLLFPDEMPRAERVRRLLAMTEEDVLWLVTRALDEASGPYAAMPDHEFWPIARAMLSGTRKVAA